MATQIQDRTSVVKGAPVVEPNNKLFWFNRPEWILYLIQFTLFQVKIMFYCVLIKISSSVNAQPNHEQFLTLSK